MAEIFVSDDVSVDIETTGKSSRAAIVSIGAVKFNPAAGVLGEQFYVTVRAGSCVAIGMEQDTDTLRWWGEQSASAREVLTCPDAVPIEAALKAFSAFVGKKCNGLWGNGPAFDNAILAEAYRLTGLAPPVPFWNDRCLRTILSTARNLGSDPKRLVEPNHAAHNALGDAIYQAQLVCKSYEIITRKQ